MTKFIDIKRKSLSLFQSDYIRLQSEVSSITSWEHTVQAVPSKKKKKKKEGEGKERGGRMICGRKDEEKGEGEGKE